MNLDEWQKINSFALWLSSFGSIFASCVALYLSKKGWTEKLLVRDTWRLEQNSYSYGFKVTNIGPLPVHIESISIKYDPKKSEHGSYIFGIGDNCKKLEYGQTLEKVSDHSYDNFPKFLVVKTSSGKVFEVKARRRFKVGFNARKIKSNSNDQQ